MTSLFLFLKPKLLLTSTSSSSILMLFLLNSSSFFILCSLISLTLGSEFQYIPSSSFRGYPYNPNPHQSRKPYLFPHNPHNQSPHLRMQANKRTLHTREHVTMQQDLINPSAFPKNTENFQKNYFQTLFNEISPSVVTNSIPSSVIQTRKLDLATRPREARRGIVDNVLMENIHSPAIKPSISASPALPFLQMNREHQGTKSFFSSRFVGSQLQVQNEEQPDEAKNEIIMDDKDDKEGLDTWIGLLGPTIQPINSTLKMSTTKIIKNSKNFKNKTENTETINKKSDNQKSTSVKKVSSKHSSAMSHYPKVDKSKKNPTTDSRTSSVTTISKSITRISKGIRAKVPKIGINRSTPHVTVVSKRIPSKSSNKSISKTSTVASSIKSPASSIKPFDSTASRNLSISKQKSQIPLHSKLVPVPWNDRPGSNPASESKVNERSLQKSTSLKTSPTEMLSLDPNSLIIKPSLQIFTNDLEYNRIEPTMGIMMNSNQIPYLQPQSQIQVPQRPEEVPFHNQFLQRNPYQFMRDSFGTAESARMKSSKNYYFKDDDSEENNKYDRDDRPPIVDPQHPLVQNALNPLGNPAKEPDQLNKKHLRILDPTSLIPLNKTYVYLGMITSWAVFFIAAFAYQTWTKKHLKGGSEFSDKTGLPAQDVPLVFNMQQDGTTIFTKRALDTEPGSRWNFTKVLEYIEIAQKTYEGFDWQNLECQQRVLCELAQKGAGETGRKLTNDYLLTMVDAVSGIPFPQMIQALLTEYKAAISQGKNSTKDCGAVYNKCKFSIKEVIAQAGQKRKNKF